MAADWIPCELNLFGKREVLSIARQTKRSRFEVGGLLLAFWGWFSTESASAVMPGVTVDQLPSLVGADLKFWRAVVEAGWIIERDDSIEIPNADRWVSRGAKARLQKNRRQDDWRHSQPGNGGGDPSTPAPRKRQSNAPDVDAPPSTATPTAPSRKASTTDTVQNREDLSRSPQQPRFQAVRKPPKRIGSAKPSDQDFPEPDALSIRQQQLVVELRELTGETGEHEGLYRQIVGRLGDSAWHVYRELKAEIDAGTRIGNRGAYLVEIAKKHATRAGIVLFDPDEPEVAHG